MNKYIDSRKHKEERPVIAICYDFDKTLSPTDMQAQGFIQSVGCDVNEFWAESNTLGEKNDMDQNLAYMLTMKQKSEGKVLFTKQQLAEYGSKVDLFKGVDTWFKRIKRYGEKQGVIVEHYIISSGLKEMIEGTKVADDFEKIYATSFYYNDNDVAVWPAQVVNYTNKTQFLSRINKGVLDISDDASLNKKMLDNERRISTSNMIYIGDGYTDVPCMKLTKDNGGVSIAVYHGENNDTAKNLLRDERINYMAKADYSLDSEIDKIVHKTIKAMAINTELKNITYKQNRGI